ncbi:protein-L-isoaspartate O-methyltransferase [Streptomyces sp. SID12501]|uniref:Protein-L-isoaspartate O-methyltransferase n=2 Tax=Streptomyces sp. SID12501 TaxID=2706042 RepID=A0A6B3C4K6_9ACTN|nr:protein-L-isoaspartate O-methyltransferase [Streptomyces sp. SID12501]NEC91757.1 protein-L-isoaspartate O-methyltransferase [Streptomyces sp. SID12501]
MVARLEEAGVLRLGPVREALLAIRREVLIPHAYVRRSPPGELPPRWDLLAWADPADRDELLALLHGGESVLIQHSGEQVLGRIPGPRSGGVITSMTSVVGMTAGLLQELDLRRGQRVLDIGTGAAVTAAIACWICGDRNVVTLDRDAHLTEAAQARLADLGYWPTAVTGDGAEGWPGGAPYERIFVSYAVPRVPHAWVGQLAPGGRAMATLSGTSPSWPGLAIVTAAADGRVQGEVRPVEFGHRPGHGFERLCITREFLGRIEAGEDTSRLVHTRTAPPPDDARGFWLALDHLYPGLVRNWGADHLVIGAPVCGSWLTARAGESGRWSLAAEGPRDIWEEIQSVAALWRAAGAPSVYRLHLGDHDQQWISAGSGTTELSWPLPGSDTADGEEAR